MNKTDTDRSGHDIFLTQRNEQTILVVVKEFHLYLNENPLDKKKQTLIKDTEFQIQGFEMANFPHDVKTQSGLTGIYNEKVTNVERMARPMGSSGGSANVPFVNHQGVRVTTDQGNQYLIHKGDGYGISSQTVVTDAKHMSNQWQSMGSRDVGGNQNVGSYVGTGGANYKLLSDNCIHGAGRISSAEEIEKLTNILHTAGKDSIPNYRKQVTSKAIGNGIWNEEISQASKHSKSFYEWKLDGQNIEKKQEMTKAKRLLRSAQRRANASRKNTFIEQIMMASQNDNKLFHQLIQNQRGVKKVNTDVMIFNAKEQAEPEDILEGWKNYFEDLYRSHNTDNESEYNTERLILATMQNEIIEQLETNRNEEIKQANEEEVTLSIQKLKTGKSPGADGISAEHLKNMPTELLQYIINIINLIFKEKDVPSKVKEGVVTPVLKSGKDKIYPENYRGITVTNCFSTLIESILKDRIEPKLLPQQSKLQRGFTEKSSSLNAAFIVTQSADFYKEILAQLVLLTLDAQKAFDKLDHEILFNKLYHDGITGNIWILLRNMYKNVAVKVKWDNTLSDQFIQRQGVRQGAKLSTILYKRYNNNILDALDRADIGAKIGNISVVAPTCADDIALLATQRDLVTINPNKSDLVPLTTKCENFSVQLGNDIIDQKTETKHLGLVRDSKNKLNIEDRLKTARKTVYAMLGPGLHARKGMSPIVALKVWQTYAIPRCLYGIEIMNYTKTDILKLERLQQQVCRQIQGLPNRTANAATYVMLGVEPIQSTIDRLVLTFFGGIIQDSASIEFMIIERQLCMSPPNSNNFINRLKEILDKYGLPKAQEIMNNKPTKEIWKRTVKRQ
ncbi:unnamed protein product [Mytilus edulis]|uniref:Reverse transcriptase domain-containing protein n=1 Tax=Mytilus edulis TaxID=6550 RepID=A0A8S3QEK2_MYTED|nr:unnamed protein product [Mytilus edulis]